MSPKFEIVKYYYGMKVWDKSRVTLAVKKNWITANEFQKITGDVYE